jgi:hypothetical protein
VKKVDTDISGDEIEKVGISSETQKSTNKEATSKATVESAAEPNIIPETSVPTEPSRTTSKDDFKTRLDSGEIIAWTSGDSLELDYQSEGEEIIEYFTTENLSAGTISYTLKVNNSIINEEEAYADEACYIASVSGHYVFLIGVYDGGSGWWTDLYTYAYGEWVFLGNIGYTSPDGDFDKFWIDSCGVLNNRHTWGQSGIVDYVQRHIIADSSGGGSSDTISLVEVPVGLTPMGNYYTAQISVPVYSNRYGDSTAWILKRGDEVICIATDVLEFIYVEKADHSQTGWIRIDYYEDTCQILDGTMMDIYEAFSGIPVGG